MMLILFSASYLFGQAEALRLKTLGACMGQGGSIFPKVRDQPFLPDTDGFR